VNKPIRAWLRSPGPPIALAITALLLAACVGRPVRTSTSAPLSTPTSRPSLLVPDLVGLPLADAKSEARNVGLLVVAKREISSRPQGTVVRQSPTAGSPIPTVHDQIDVVLSKYSKVPSLIGLSVGRAKARSESLRLGPIHKVASTQERGVVLRQAAVRNGRRMPAGSLVGVAIVSPHLCGSPLNPWCFSVGGGGSMIYRPPATLCTWINCIASFWSYTNGYVIQCVDGEFSHSGGVSGSCSSHGGNWRPLYG
jgi:PASTA domain